MPTPRRLRLRRLRAVLLATSALMVVPGCTASETDPGSATGEPDPSATGSTPAGTSAAGGWTATLDSRPTVALVGPAGAYVTSAGSSRFAPQVYRLALDDGRELARRTAVGQPNDAALAPDGWLWLAAARHPDQPAGTGVTIHDPLTLLAVDRAELGDTPLSIAAVDGSMWAGARGQIFVLDASTHQVTRTIAIRGPAYQLLPSADGRHVLVVEGDALEMVSVDGELLARVSLVTSGSATAVVTGDVAWVRVPVDVDSELRRYELPTLAEAPAGPRLDSVSGGLVSSAANVWAVDDRTDLVCVRPDGSVARGPAAGAVGVMGALADSRLLLATASGVEVRVAACTGVS